jgi:hypothetical protein
MIRWMAENQTDPDKLVRQRAGRYRTADDRFGVEQSATGWFLVDAEQTDELGQPLMAGPFATLDAVRTALPGARKVHPITKPAGRRAKAAARERGGTAERSGGRAAGKALVTPAQPKRTWIDDLEPGQAREARALVAALEKEGIANAESLVRADRTGLLPAVGSRLIELRLEALVNERPADERKAARDLVWRAAEILAAEGMGLRPPLPRWTLVEIGSNGEPPNRRIILRRR